MQLRRILLESTKYIIPFISGILLIWIKDSIENNIKKNRLIKISIKLLIDLLKDIDAVEETINNIINAAKNNNYHIATILSPDLLYKYISQLSEYDHKNSLIYSELISQIEIIRKEIEKYDELISARMKSLDELEKNKLNKNIIGCCYSMQINFNEVFFKCIDILKAKCSKRHLKRKKIKIEEIFNKLSTINKKVKIGANSENDLILKEVRNSWYNNSNLTHASTL